MFSCSRKVLVSIVLLRLGGIIYVRIIFDNYGWHVIALSSFYGPNVKVTPTGYNLFIYFFLNIVLFQ